jgi:hypothetical protein
MVTDMILYPYSTIARVVVKYSLAVTRLENAMTGCNRFPDTFQHGYRFCFITSSKRGSMRSQATGMELTSINSLDHSTYLAKSKLLSVYGTFFTEPCDPVSE